MRTLIILLICLVVESEMASLGGGEMILPNGVGSQEDGMKLLTDEDRTDMDQEETIGFGFYPFYRPYWGYRGYYSSPFFHNPYGYGPYFGYGYNHPWHYWK